MIIYYHWDVHDEDTFLKGFIVVSLSRSGGVTKAAIYVPHNTLTLIACQTIRYNTHLLTPHPILPLTVIWNKKNCIESESWRGFWFWLHVPSLHLLCLVDSCGKMCAPKMTSKNLRFVTSLLTLTNVWLITWSVFPAVLCQVFTCVCFFIV